MAQSFNVPLPRVSIDTLVAIAQQCDSDDSTAMNEIIRRFEPLTRRLVGAIHAADHYLRDDLANTSRLGLVVAVRRHNGALGFGNYAKLHMRGAVLREYGRWISPETVDGEAVARLQATAQEEDSMSSVLDEMAPWGSGSLANGVEALEPMQRVILEMLYLDDAPVWAVAEVTGTSSQAVTQRVKTIQRRLRLAVAA